MINTKQLTKRNTSRGSAVVEFGILMLILIPVLLYAFFAGEAGRVLLLMQEEVIATIWDYASYPYSLNKTYDPSGGGMKQKFDTSVSDDSNPISTFNRIEYIDEDSAFTNSKVVKNVKSGRGSLKDGKIERYVTNSFVVGTHCGGGRCVNRLYVYERPSDAELQAGMEKYKKNRNSIDGDDNPHEVFCGRVYGKNGFSKAGLFAENRLGRITGISKIADKSSGGLVACQAKARLKNYILPGGKFFPEFYGDDFALSGDTYAGKRKMYKKSDGGVIDYGAFTGDIVVRHRAALLTDAWNLRDHGDQNMYSTNTVSKFVFNNKATHFKEIVNNILHSGEFYAAPGIKVLAYSNAAKNLAIVPFDGDNDVLPGIMRTNLVTMYPHGSGKIDDYNYAPLISLSGVSGISTAFKRFFRGQNTTYFTTPMYNGNKAKYADVFNARGKYYMGKKESSAK